ncbi:signal peptidase II [Sporolactobacillus inulinus]|uniref:Lipoprotein signal peptidase n=2 Tax=Sporolactobacillus inulinus TaxID=2078 RepID=A0A4Y1ZBN9_9BACL|nr:signal peptidase II [Sporolactobacillus inulinus]KLI01791.1 peptidase A8 [Sporolactobacillus inulinus CASD]GAY76506.1 lipoprotein signal peptidase [Sporolactobacillus inulinus]GEB76422.1 lipoprotein signal peptidase [Sporolactobacillus inulinus]
MVYYALALIILIIDQCSKGLVVHNMALGQSITMIPNFFYLTSIRNNGAAWSILEGQFVFFFIITAVVLIIVIYYMQTLGRKQPLLGTSLGLIIGGTLGNFVDRLFRGEVVDFLHFYLIRYNFPVFNLADSSLFLGVVLLIIYLFLDGKKDRQ